ncbi:hypothetical protein RRF57_013170 [Xylaria bambusicola]|uniref:Uncharacterized protein n=1 Tax=Xylaria bambusicola TaxID=326684 RepID=A0AAN7UR74_9PEZI
MHIGTDTTDNPISGTGVSTSMGTTVRSDGKHTMSTAKTKSIRIRNGKDNASECARCGHDNGEHAYTAAPKPNQTRTRYQMMDRSFARRCVETTYYMVNGGAYICAALMRVNRAVHEETAHWLYGTHTFDFGCDVEAVRPFLSDLSGATRRLVTRVALYKKGPWLYDCWSDRCEWRTMCNYLRDHAFVRHLQLVVQAGRLSESREWEWESDSPRELTSKDVALLVDIRHDTLHWVGDIIRLRSLRGVEVIPDYCTVPPPQTSNMFVFLAFSASVNTGFVEFLSDRLQLAC